MKRLSRALLCGAACLASASVASAQDRPKGYSTVIPATVIAPENSAAAQFHALVSPAPIPSFQYTLTAAAGLGGGTFSGSIIGRNPLLHGKTTTTVPTQVIPLVITINDTTGGTGTVTYDPTLPDGCVAGNPTDVSILVNSPIFTKTTTWLMNGVNVGTTQYIDAFQRAQFWGQVAGTPYHVILNETTLGAQAHIFTAGTNYNAATQFGGCGFIGVVNINDMDAVVQALITGPLAGTVNVGTFPVFQTKNVVMAITGHSIFVECCVLGYHSGLFVGGELQIYSPLVLDTSGVFDDDVSVMAHEMGEAINDPTGSNPTPLWGAIGQQPNCQNNLEVGDPLSPGGPNPPGTNTFVVPGVVIPQYHLQELAFYSWFFGSNGLGTGAGNGFSNNGTFKGFAKLCPPGGTN